MHAGAREGRGQVQEVCDATSYKSLSEESTTAVQIIAHNAEQIDVINGGLLYIGQLAVNHVISH